MALSRPHALAVANMDAHLPSHAQLWNSFAKISASDEMYFPSALAVLQIIQDPRVVSRLREQKEQGGSMDGKPRKNNSNEEDSNKETTENMNGEEDVEQEAKEESSDNKDESDNKKAEDGTGDATTTTATTTETEPEPTVESLSPTVRFKSVTYTDWSEGMRNPKSFFRGPNDLRTISRLARQQGSLVARKFIMCAPNSDSSGKAREELSGSITVDDWKQVLEESVPLAGTGMAESES